MLELRVLPVGEFQSNCYLVVDASSGQGVLIDAGDQVEAILHWIKPVKVNQILVTHGHSDHVGALESLRQALGVPVGIHPADVASFGLEADFTLHEGDSLVVGGGSLQVIHIPGHTPGSVAFKVEDAEGVRRAVVGDAIFPGGPGHTKTPEDLVTSLDSLARTVFTWADEVVLYPGHGDPTTVGEEREAFEAFRSLTLPPDLSGDVTWR
ncbi:MAG: MBL fold metallo-hydrolase [Anaerolineales bacterium]|nr:MBL fold metallo-hydrolase [Anaerolineales bacterium]